jgi:2-(1,2-epoxy-1,2-dihydrophenyl)acetyl-CoA isomerase
MADEIFRFERDGDVALIVLDNPARRNPMSVAFQRGLRELLGQVRADRSVRALVITGEGRGFCAGADLSLVELADGDGPGAGERARDEMHALSNALILDLRDLPVPVVAAVNGACVGGGVGLALAADVVLAARSAYFYLPFIPRLGLVPDLGTTTFLQRLAGQGRAMALTLLGDRLPAERAAEWGVVWACVDDGALREEALAVARRLARLPAHGAIEARRIFEAAARNSLREQLAYEAERQRELSNRPTFVEGVRAFLEKREPRFGGRS